MQDIMGSGRLTFAFACISATLIPPLRLSADGGFFFTGSADLAQVRQEAILAVHPDGTKVTYVLRSLHEGQSDEFAWVLPVPATPTDVMAHEDSAFFLALDQATRPSFLVLPASAGGGCACGVLDGAGETGAIVQVEASGKAGVFDWAALSSTGGDALVDWLGTNGFDIPASAAPVLDAYVQQGMHFLAVRVRESVAAQSGLPSEIPPIQFTVESTRRFYPMVISRISAANETEVILYVLSQHRAEPANVADGQIAEEALLPDANSQSLTNYEQVFTQTIAGLGGLALITEYAMPFTGGLSSWPEMPAEFSGAPLFLTRMRTVIPSDRMNQDFEFQDASTDTEVSNFFTVTQPRAISAAAGQAATVLAAVGGMGLLRLRRRRLRRAPGG